MFFGLLVAIVTPFKNGRIDTEALRRHVEWLASEGAHGIVPCGTTGEGATLKPEEYLEVVGTVADEVRDKCLVIAGAGSNSTAKAIELAKLVTEAGATATLQVTPYYNKPTQTGLYEHFKAIANEVKKPHILYNVPGRTSVNMLPETVERLSKIDNIVGIKEASGHLEQVAEIRKRTPDEFVILSGNDDQNFEIYRLGGNGSISVTGNIAPAKVAEVWDLFNRGQISDAEKLQESLQELNKVMFIETNPIPVKTAVSLLGYCREEFRLPMTPMSPDHKESLKTVLKKYKLL